LSNECGDARRVFVVRGYHHGHGEWSERGLVDDGVDRAGGEESLGERFGARGYATIGLEHVGEAGSLGAEAEEPQR